MILQSSQKAAPPADTTLPVRSPPAVELDVASCHMMLVSLVTHPRVLLTLPHSVLSILTCSQLTTVPSELFCGKNQKGTKENPSLGEESKQEDVNFSPTVTKSGSH